jgi:hypothetical protein
MIVLVVVLVVAAIALVMFDARRGPQRSRKSPMPNRGPHRRARVSRPEDQAKG